MKIKKKACTKGTIDSNLAVLLTPEQAAEYLNVSSRTLANWRSVGRPHIEYTRVGRTVRYYGVALEAYLVKHIVSDVEA